MKNLPTDLLRTFVTIIQLGGFTQAGERLGRSQPAVSLQMKRLEELLDVKLFNRGQGLQLTEEGQLLLTCAQRMLELNDTLISRLGTPRVSGSVRLGIPNDFEVSFLATTLGRFSQAYPEVTLDVSSDISANLLSDYKKGAYDLVMAIEESRPNHPQLTDYITEPLVWVRNNNMMLSPDAPLPLILYPKGCLYRRSIINALTRANLPWRIVYSTSSLLGIQSAIKAGLGISVLSKSTVPDGLEASPSFAHCPDLGSVSIGFCYDANELTSAGHMLLDYLKQGLNAL
ncbi:LysR substrate-binding domain-containing protein [Oceanimonas sp. CHS3-5]|uniref:LysR substrate-binding domain-containing protein n=1 Tax=Oceanimonas sp. CHS3-5 TaxID=3068186 RepID=UPI00273D3C40|nr:LysR substrate-binding domain-containing protein [Oceanimonas sp. CHS3-5]MDP5291563.1 LysR substrate-binding domain-containing protein [Oceanimonas sp. CHS3-5]